MPYELPMNLCIDLCEAMRGRGPLTVIPLQLDAKLRSQLLEAIRESIPVPGCKNSILKKDSTQPEQYTSFEVYAVACKNNIEKSLSKPEVTWAWLLLLLLLTFVLGFWLQDRISPNDYHLKTFKNATCAFDPIA